MAVRNRLPSTVAGIVLGAGVAAIGGSPVSAGHVYISGAAAEAQEWAVQAAASATSALTSLTTTNVARDATFAARDLAQGSEVAAYGFMATSLIHRDRAISEAAAAGASNTAARASELAASASQAAAAVSAVNALTSEGNAAGSATASQTSRLASEAARDLALQYRNTADAHRAAAATSDTNAAASATASQTARVGSETARTGAETARTGAETARTGAETAQGTALTHRLGSEAARDVALGYRNTADAHRIAAQSAQSATEAARDLTLGYRDAASLSATNAATSASTADSHRISAGEQATASAASATNSQTARTGAETARTGAETAQTGAQTARTGAETAQTGAQTARTGSETARDAALGYRNTTDAHRIAAQSAQSASEAARDLALSYRDAASLSATNAATSATTADNHRVSAGEQATASATSATNSANSATAAAASAAAALASENTAGNYATWAWRNANEAINVELAPGSGDYSARHWAAMAQNFATGSAANISVVPVGALVATNAQSAFEELDADLTALSTSTTQALSTKADAASTTQALSTKADTASLGTLASKSTIVSADITDGTITNADLANMPATTLKGNNAGAAAVPLDLTVAQVKALLSLNNVTNTTDANKPVSTAQQTALNLKANLASPTFTGTPAAPTAAAATNTTQIATTAFVRAEVAALVNASPAALDTLNELATALGNDPNFATTVNASIATKAPTASPALTGVPTAPTAAAATDTTQIATTAFARAEVTSGVAAAIAALVNAAPAGLDTLNELAIALGNDPAFATTVNTNLATKAGLISPKFARAAAGSSQGAAIQLEAGTTGTVLGGGAITIDVNGNSVRIYESGTPYKGVTVDLNGAASQSNLWHSNNFNPATKLNAATPVFTGILQGPGASISAASGYAITGYGGVSSGGVIGYTNGQNYYGILGYNNGYSFYGNGPIYSANLIATGTVEVSGILWTYGSANSTTTSAANVYMNPAGNVHRSTSSLFYKRDIEDMWDEVGDLIYQLRPVWYRADPGKTIDDPTHSFYGLIAEEVAVIDPRLAFWGNRPIRDADGNLQFHPREVPALDENGDPVLHPATITTIAGYGEAGEPIIVITAHPQAGKPIMVPNPSPDAGKPVMGDELVPDGVQYERLTVPLINCVQRIRIELDALKNVVGGHDVNVVTNRQFYHGLAKRELITFDEARAAVRTGDIPATMLNVLNTPEFAAALPEGYSMEDVLLIIEGAQTFERHHPVSELIIARFGWTPTYADEFWTFCATL